jgi:hypothetical protein
MEKFKVTVDEKGKVEAWMDGHILKGIRGIEFYWEVGEVPTHKVEFVTQVAKFEPNMTVIEGGE